MAELIKSSSSEIHSIEWNSKDENNMLLFLDKQTISIPECKDKGLHFLLWGVAGSPDSEDYIISSDEGDIKRYTINHGANEGYDVIGKNEFCILDLPHPKWENYYVNGYTGAGTCLYASFFETTPTLYLDTTLNGNGEGVEDEAMVLFKHRFYPKYEVYDFPENEEIDLLYNEIDLMGVLRFDEESSVTIPKNDNFSKMDIFIVTLDSISKDAETDTITLNDKIIYSDRMSLYNNSFGFVMSFDNEIEDEMVLTFSNPGDGSYCIKSIKIIYHN